MRAQRRLRGSARAEYDAHGKAHGWRGEREVDAVKWGVYMMLKGKKQPCEREKKKERKRASDWEGPKKRARWNGKGQREGCSPVFTDLGAPTDTRSYHWTVQETPCFSLIISLFLAYIFFFFRLYFYFYFHSIRTFNAYMHFSVTISWTDWGSYGL